MNLGMKTEAANLGGQQLLQTTITTFKLLYTHNNLIDHACGE